MIGLNRIKCSIITNKCVRLASLPLHELLTLIICTDDRFK